MTTNTNLRLLLLLGAAIPGACAQSTRGVSTTAPGPAVAAGGLAQVYLWRAKAGKFDEYSRYIRDVAEPIDHEAQHAGAFLSVTTYASNDSTIPWTHMRVFILRDSAQLRGLSDALTQAGVRMQPDSAKRRMQGEYSATLRDRVGATVSQIIR
jgi:hypothetical protein